MLHSLSLVTLLGASAAFAQEPPLPPPPEVPAPVVAPPPAPPRLLTRFEADEHVVFGEASRDVFGMGQGVSVESNVEDNAFLMGQDVEITSPVGGDVLAMGQSITIDAPIGGDVYALGQNVVVTSRGSIAGDLIGGGETIDVRGPIAGDVQIGAGTFALAAPVSGLVEAEVGAIELGTGASIGGDLDYSAPSEVSGLEGVVKGETRFTLAEEDDLEFEHHDEPTTFASAALWWAACTGWSYVAKLILGAIFLAIGGAAAARVSRAILDQPAQSFGWGFVVSCVLFVGSVTAIAMIVPLPVGILGLLLFAFLMYGAQVITAQALGDWLLARFRPGAIGNPYVSLAVGLVPLVLLASIPWLGTLVWLAATLVGVGALWVANRAAPSVA